VLTCNDVVYKYYTEVPKALKARFNPLHCKHRVLLAGVAG
jgi:hypothetical protein